MSSRQITEVNQPKEREFSLEKIACAIHCQNLISSLRNKYQDPLIIRRKPKNQKIRPRRHLKMSLDKESSFSKNQLSKDSMEIQKVDNEKDKQNNLSRDVLPIIPNSNKNQKEVKSKISLYKNKDFLTTSGMFKQKDFFKDPSNKMKLGSMLNIKAVNDNIMKNYYQKIDNINKINDKYNLQLNLKYLENNYPEKSHMMSKKLLMNYLFKKYVISSPNGNDENNTNNANSRKKRHKSRRKSVRSKKSRNNVSDEFIKTNTISNSVESENNSVMTDVFKKDFSEDTNTFITKVDADKPKEIKKETSIFNSEIVKKRKNNDMKIYEKNKNIINQDKKITIECLYSNKICKVEPKQLLYNSIEKTAFQAQNQPSYRRVKKFENMIDKIMKSQNEYSISVNK